MYIFTVFGSRAASFLADEAEAVGLVGLARRIRRGVFGMAKSGRRLRLALSEVDTEVLLAGFDEVLGEEYGTRGQGVSLKYEGRR